MEPKVIIVILNWNRLKDILDCLNSVFKQDYSNYEVVVVDNASADGSCEVIKRAFRTVHLIQNSENMGYVRANNIGIRYAISENTNYIWLLNNDVTVDPKCLKEIVRAAEESNLIGLVSPIIYHFEEPNELQYTGSYINMKDLSVVYPESYNQDRERSEVREHMWLWGTALLIKRNVVERIGYLRSEYFAYWEDTEYSLRSIKAGFKNIICMSGKVFHKHQLQGVDGAKKGKYYYYFMQRNKMFLGDEYLGGSIDRLIYKVRCLAELSEYTRHCSEEDIDACMDGAWHGIKGITGPMRGGNKMPNYIKRLLILMSRHYPVFIADLITLRLGAATRKILRKVSMRY